jgi:hypothetical protein
MRVEYECLVERLCSVLKWNSWKNSSCNVDDNIIHETDRLLI